MRKVLTASLAPTPSVCRTEESRELLSRARRLARGGLAVLPSGRHAAHQPVKRPFPCNWCPCRWATVGRQTDRGLRRHCAGTGHACRASRLADDQEILNIPARRFNSPERARSRLAVPSVLLADLALSAAPIEMTSTRCAMLRAAID